MRVRPELPRFRPSAWGWVLIFSDSHALSILLAWGRKWFREQRSVAALLGAIGGLTAQSSAPHLGRLAAAHSARSPRTFFSLLARAALGLVPRRVPGGRGHTRQSAVASGRRQHSCHTTPRRFDLRAGEPRMQNSVFCTTLGGGTMLIPECYNTFRDRGRRSLAGLGSSVVSS